jgi:predicted thioesterase
MLKATPYIDLIKANDLVSKNFLNQNSFSITTETKAGDVVFKSSVSGDEKKPLAAVLEDRYEWKEKNLTFDGKLSTANAFSLKGTYKNLFVDGLNVSLRGDRSIERKEDAEQPLNVSNSVTAGVLYNDQHVHLTADVKVPVKSSGNLSVSTAVTAKPVDQVNVGVKVDWLASVTSFEGKLIGANDQLEGAVTFNSDRVWGFNFWHLYSSKFQWATAVSVPPATAKRNPDPVINVAGAYKFDDSTTVKAKFNVAVDKTEAAEHAFRAALSLQQKLNPYTTVTVGADVNLNHALNIGSGKKVTPTSSCGFQIAFK